MNDLRDDLAGIRSELAAMNANHTHTMARLEEHHKVLGKLANWRSLIVGGLTVVSALGGLAYHSFSGMLASMMQEHDTVTQQQVIVQDLQTRLTAAENDISALSNLQGPVPQPARRR